MVASENLLVRPRVTDDGFGETISFTPDAVGWDHLGFRSIKIAQGESIASHTKKTEIAIVVLGGKCSVTSSAGTWSRFGRRENVFDGLAHTPYLPIDTEYVLTAETDADIAICSCPAEKKFPARLITPAQVKVDIRGAETPLVRSVTSSRPMIRRTV